MKRSQQAQLLRQLNPLTVYPQWADLDEYLGLLIDQLLDQLLGCTSWEQAKELQGRIKAFKAIRALPETIKQSQQFDG